MNTTWQQICAITGTRDPGEIRRKILGMGPDEYAVFRRRVLLGRYCGEKSYQHCLEMLGIAEVLHVVDKES